MGDLSVMQVATTTDSANNNHLCLVDAQQAAERQLIKLDCRSVYRHQIHVTRVMTFLQPMDTADPQVNWRTLVTTRRSSAVTLVWPSTSSSSSSSSQHIPHSHNCTSNISACCLRPGRGPDWNSEVSGHLRPMWCEPGVTWSSAYCSLQITGRASPGLCNQHPVSLHQLHLNRLSDPLHSVHITPAASSSYSPSTLSPHIILSRTHPRILSRPKLATKKTKPIKKQIFSSPPLLTILTDDEDHFCFPIK